MQARVQREQVAHTEHDVLAENLRIKQRFSHLFTSPSLRRFYARIDSYVHDIAGRNVLDYGCGRGTTSLTYLGRGALVQGIDLSSVYIASAKKAASEAGIPTSQYGFHVMDAHDLAFPNETFDLVVGFGILHHLDPDLALAEIHRVLRPGGRVLLHEPLADNPLLKLFRLLTPQARTVDEAPFTGAEVHRLTQTSDWEADLSFCGLLSTPVAMLTSILLPQKPDNVLLRWADAVELWTHRKGFLLSWNQYVLFNLVKLK